MNGLIVFAAQYLILLPIGVTLYLLITLPKSKRLELVQVLVIGGILAFIFSKLGSHFYYNPRPFYVDHVTPLFPPPHDNGFPSDHTLLSSYLAYCCLLFSRKLGVLFIGVAIIIGTARVAANVHHGIDVLGGLVLAALAVYLAVVVQRRFSRTRQG